jgi:leucyl-tRNA synthetase
MHKELKHFYPLDSRHSGRDLVSNHLTFMIFNHTAIFPEEMWPRQIVTNGSVMMKGVKMSKSFGNIIPLREALGIFGADPLRLSVLATAELLQDAEFSPQVAKSMHARLERLYKFVAELVKTKNKQGFLEKSLTTLDRWMLSRLQEHIKKATEAMDRLAVRKAVHEILYGIDKDFQWYQRRTIHKEERRERENTQIYVSKKVIDAQIRMLTPIAPHICEELWEMIGGKDFISLNPWPVLDESKVDIKTEENETLIKRLLEDTLNIIKTTKIKPTKIHYYVAAPWKWKIYSKVLQMAVSSEILQQDLIRELLKDPYLKSKTKEVNEFLGKILVEIKRIPNEKKQRMIKIGVIDEAKTLKEAKVFLEQELDVQLCLYQEGVAECYDPKNRARNAKPYRPAIFLE